MFNNVNIYKCKCIINVLGQPVCSAMFEQVGRSLSVAAVEHVSPPSAISPAVSEVEGVSDSLFR